MFETSTTRDKYITFILKETHIQQLSALFAVHLENDLVLQKKITCMIAPVSEFCQPILFIF